MRSSSVANPSDLDTSRLAPIDVAGEIKRAHDGMVGINKIDVLGESDRATKANIVDHLNTGPDIFYLVCHGALIDGKSMLWLEDDAGKAERVDGASRGVVAQRAQAAAAPRGPHFLSKRWHGSR